MTRIVVKLGGHALDDLSPGSGMLRALAEDLVMLRHEGTDVVIVHGGGPQIADLLARVGLTSEFHEGLRITTKETMPYVAMALASVNFSLVAALSRAGLYCVGLSGVDGDMLLSQSLGPRYDRAATVAKVTPDVIYGQWRAGALPVVCPVGFDENGQLLNCNADIVAGALAGARRPRRRRERPVPRLEVARRRDDPLRRRP